jgi:DNA repair exonuclease SbcCD ATPase subunit
VDIEKLLVYYVGTQEPPQRVLEDPEVIALLNPQPNEVAKQLQGLKTVCVVLSEELGEVKEELARIASAKGDTTQLMDRIGRLEQQIWRQTEEFADRIGSLEQQVSMQDERLAEVKEQVANANSGAGGVGDIAQLLDRIGRLEKQLSMQTEESGVILVAMKKERVEQEKAHKKAMQKLEQQREELLDCARQVEEVKAHFMGILGKSPLLAENITQSTSKSHKRKQGATSQQESQVVISPPSTVRSVIPDSQSTDGGLSFLEEE